MARRKTTKTPPMKFYKKLVLNQFFLKLFGVNKFEELAEELKKVKNEGYTGENNTYYYEYLTLNFADKCSIARDELLKYDENIVRHTFRISERREQTIKWKYFQYLSLLFTEIYLEKYFRDKNRLLEELNEYVEGFNSDKDKQDKIEKYSLEDLNKIAFWNATGSGKTLIMHVNILQFLHYLKQYEKMREINRIILLTPNEGLSAQHKEELDLSNLKGSLFDKKAGGLFTRYDKQIDIIDIHKLRDESGDKTVAVESFESNNLVLVDEGHRGSSGVEWKDKRDRICENGFSFEYSATFGQAIKSAKKKELEQEYAKSILFDYSYRYFYGDGYGKDYSILNLADDTDEDRRKLYLTACLMSYYQQLKIYEENKRELIPFLLEKPLLVFVGGTVNAVYRRNKKDVSDVVDVLLLFSDFIQDIDQSIGNIERLLSGSPGLLDQKGREIFKDSFSYIVSKNMTHEAVYMDMLKTVFNADVPGAQLHIDNLKGIEGEIGLRVGEEEYFGVINVGDDTKLIKLCDNNGLLTETREFSNSLFRHLNEESSSVNVLIGSKKFTEGWNSWRVSTMGLLNIGRSEGSEVIQLFGRGVRLKGYQFSLKRSSRLEDINEKQIPKIIKPVETLNIFGVRADYMQQFKEYLEEEGLPNNEGKKEITLPVIRNIKGEITNKLKTLKVKSNLDFKKNGPKPILGFPEGLMEKRPIVVDWYPKLQLIKSGNREKAKEQGYKNTGKLSEKHIAFIDFDEIYFEIQRYKNEKSWYNFNISKDMLKELLASPTWYKLELPEEELEFTNFKNYRRWQEIATVLLKKYCEAYYHYKKSAWELPRLEYKGLQEDDPNFIKEYKVTVYDDDEAESLKYKINQLSKEIEKGSLKDIDMSRFKHGGFEPFDFRRHFYTPLIFIAKGETQVEVSPVNLNEGEKNFVTDLKNYYDSNFPFFEDKELYLLRNKSKAGIGFFEAGNFYPDFIMWILYKDKQYITFVDPKGIRYLEGGEENPKIKFYKKIKDIEKRIGNSRIILNSFILSFTTFTDIRNTWRGSITKEFLEEKNVLFQQDDRDKYIGKMIDTILASSINP